MKTKHIIIITAILVVISAVFYYLYDKADTDRIQVYTIPEVVELIWPTPETIRDKTLKVSEDWETIADYKIIMIISNDLMREIKGEHYVIPQIQVNSMKPFLMESVPVGPIVPERTTSTWSGRHHSSPPPVPKSICTSKLF